MNDLAGFLLARIAEDEADAIPRFALYSGDRAWCMMNHSPFAETYCDWKLHISSEAEGEAAKAEHNLSHANRRTMAEVRAKRQIFQRAVDLIASFGDWDAADAEAAGGRKIWTDVNRRERACGHDLLAFLADSYRYRPDFRPEWGDDMNSDNEERCRHLRNGEIRDDIRDQTNFQCLDCERVFGFITDELRAEPVAYDYWVSQCAEINHRLWLAAGPRGTTQ